MLKYYSYCYVTEVILLRRMRLVYHCVIVTPLLSLYYMKMRSVRAHDYFLLRTDILVTTCQNQVFEVVLNLAEVMFAYDAC